MGEEEVRQELERRGYTLGPRMDEGQTDEAGKEVPLFFSRTCRQCGEVSIIGFDRKTYRGPLNREAPEMMYCDDCEQEALFDLVRCVTIQTANERM
jgi:hypothetical protein